MSKTKVSILFLLCWFIASEGSPVHAGFSDRLVGKEKLPAGKGAMQESVAPASKGVAEKNVVSNESRTRDRSALSQTTTVNSGNRLALGSFDVVGLRLGMRQEEAVTVLQGRKLELNGKPLTFEVVKERKYEGKDEASESRTHFVTMSNANSVLAAFGLSEEAMKGPKALQDPKAQQFIANGQFEAFLFQFPNLPNEARVSAITRLQRLAPPVHPDTIRNALMQKYGVPTIDDKMVMVWLTKEVGDPIAASAKSRFSCRGISPSIGNQIAEFDHSLLAIKGCGDQLTVQLQGTPASIMLIQTTLINHQQLVEQRQATTNAALSKFGLTPEQSKQTPAPQF